MKHFEKALRAVDKDMKENSSTISVLRTLRSIRDAIPAKEEAEMLLPYSTPRVSPSAKWMRDPQ